MTFATEIWDAVQNQIAEKAGDLNLPLSAITHSTSHTLSISRDFSSPLPSGAWSSSFTANAKASCSYDVLDSGEIATFGLVASEGNSLMQVMVQGSLAFDLGGKFPAAAFSFGADATASGDVQMTWIFAETSSKISGVALAEDIPRIKLPMNLQEIYAQSQSASWQQTRMSIDGKLGLGINLTASENIVGAAFSALAEVFKLVVA